MAALGAAFTVFLAAVGILIVVTWLGRVTDPQRVPPPEAVPFLGGYPPQTHAWSRFHVRYYVMALLFIAFEMEMMFMYPWAVVYAQEGMKALVEMGMFLAILALGVLYAWREGGFRWQ